jgi:hypothetical protein
VSGAATAAALQNRAREQRRPSRPPHRWSKPIALHDARVQLAVIRGMNRLPEVRALSPAVRFTLQFIVDEIFARNGHFICGHMQMAAMIGEMSMRTAASHSAQLRGSGLVRAQPGRQQRSGGYDRMRYTLGQPLRRLARIAEQELRDQGIQLDLICDAKIASPSPRLKNGNYVVSKLDNARASDAPADPTPLPANRSDPQRTRAENGITNPAPTDQLEDPDPQQLLQVAEQLAHEVGIVLKPIDRSTLIRLANRAPPEFWKFAARGVKYAVERNIENVGGTAAVFAVAQMQFARVAIPQSLQRFTRSEAQLEELRSRGLCYVSNRPIHHERARSRPERIGNDAESRKRNRDAAARSSEPAGRQGKRRIDREAKRAASRSDNPGERPARLDTRCAPSVAFMRSAEWEFFKRTRQVPEDAPLQWKKFLEERAK